MLEQYIYIRLYLYCSYLLQFPVVMEISDIPDRKATATLPHTGSDLRKRPRAIPQVSGLTSETKDPDPGYSVSETGKSCEDEGNRMYRQPIKRSGVYFDSDLGQCVD